MTFFPAFPARRALLLLTALLAPTMGMAQDLTLELRDGRVKLSAHNVPASWILAEWGRIGQTRIINGDRVIGPPLTLELEWVSERDALATILRNASGYVAAPRPTGAQGASMYDRILIMPGGSSPLAARAPQPPPPVFPQPQEEPNPLTQETLTFDPAAAEDAQVLEPPEEVQMPGATGPGEIAQPLTPGQGGEPFAFPGNYPGVPPGSGAGAANPWNVPAGTPMPGMISPPPQPLEPNNPQPPPQ